MKSVVFDLLCAQPVGGSKFHGGGEYTKYVFKAFIEVHGDSLPVIACFNPDEFIDDWILQLIDMYHVTIKTVQTTVDIVGFLGEIDKDDDIHFFAGLAYAYQNVNFPKNVRSIGTCHGLRAVEKLSDTMVLKYTSLVDCTRYIKQLIKLRFGSCLTNRYLNLYRGAIKSFDVIITDSNHSNASIKLNYSDEVNEKELYVFYPMTQKPFIFEYVQKLGTGTHIMIVSANRWIKNSYRAVKALDELFDSRLIGDVKVSVYGGYPMKLRRKVKAKERFQFYDYVSSEELELAYRNSDILLYPTLNEGFGNVPMEAMKYGKTCIVSGVCSLPEVYGDAVYYCNPYDIMEIKNRIIQACEAPKNKMVIEKRLEQIQKRQLKDLSALCNIIAGLQALEEERT